MTIPESVTLIGSTAFAYCSKLISVKYNAINCADHTNPFTDIFNDSGAGLTLTIGSKVKRIPEQMFKNADGLETVVFEQNSACEKIGQQAFMGCTNLSFIIYNGTTSEWKNIKLYLQWAYKVPATYVSCTNGTVNI